MEPDGSSSGYLGHVVGSEHMGVDDRSAACPAGQSDLARNVSQIVPTLRWLTLRHASHDASLPFRRRAIGKVVSLIIMKQEQ